MLKNEEFQFIGWMLEIPCYLEFRVNTLDTRCLYVRCNFLMDIVQLVLFEVLVRLLSLEEQILQCGV